MQPSICTLSVFRPGHVCATTDLRICHGYELAPALRPKSQMPQRPLKDETQMLPTAPSMPPPNPSTTTAISNPFCKPLPVSLHREVLLQPVIDNKNKR